MERFFNKRLIGSTDQVKNDLRQSMEQKLPIIPLQSLTALAAQKGHAEILQFCLSQGAVLDRYVDKAALVGLVRYPPMLDTLWAVNWRNMNHSREALDDLVRANLSL